MPYMGSCRVVFKMVYCSLTLRIIRSVYINHFETTTNPHYMRGHNQKKDTHTLDFDVTLLSEDPCSIRGLPPRLGENTQKLLEEPGLSGQGILELADEGIF